jgi:hypothetical protein
MGSGWVDEVTAHKAGVWSRPGAQPLKKGGKSRGDAFEDALVNDIVRHDKLPDISFNGPTMPRFPSKEVATRTASAAKAGAAHPPAKTDSAKNLPTHHKAHVKTPHTHAEMEAPAMPPTAHAEALLAGQQFKAAFDSGGTPSAPAGKPGAKIQLG